MAFSPSIKYTEPTCQFRNHVGASPPWWSVYLTLVLRFLLSHVSLFIAVQTQVIQLNYKDVQANVTGTNLWDSAQKVCCTPFLSPESLAFRVFTVTSPSFLLPRD